MGRVQIIESDSGQVLPKFGAFIMTYERPKVLMATIEKILSQTFPPEKILIVDNSESDNTQSSIQTLDCCKIHYFRTGHNAGPAGAAKIGLELLTEEGYDWIYWGDDDDPPRFPDCFELLLKNVNSGIGAIGAVGSQFDWSTGLRRRYKDEELNGLLPVDTIGGGFCMLVNAHVLDSDTLPNPKLYFGLEEFDFCQKLIKKGFQVCVLGELLYRYRAQSNKLGLEKRPSIIPRRELGTIHREYYTYRNGIYLMLYEFKKYKIALLYIIKGLVKIPFGFFKGVKFGFRNARILLLAIMHGVVGKLGKVF